MKTVHHWVIGGSSIQNKRKETGAAETKILSVLLTQDKSHLNTYGETHSRCTEQ